MLRRQSLSTETRTMAHKPGEKCLDLSFKKWQDSLRHMHCCKTQHALRGSGQASGRRQGRTQPMAHRGLRSRVAMYSCVRLTDVFFIPVPYPFAFQRI